MADAGGRADPCLLASIERAVATAPDRPALVFAETAHGPLATLTLAELLSQACAVALGLRAAGVRGGERIADFCDEGPALVLAFVAIMRAGATIVPLDPAAPAARVRALVYDCEPSTALCSAVAAPALEERLGGVVPLVTLEHALASGASPAPTPSLPRPAHLSHVVYTSGSSGAPKGVACPHRALAAYAHAKAASHGVGATSRVLLASAHAWDPALGDVLSTLAAGATLCCAPRAALITVLGGVLRATRATHVCATPSLWSLLREPPAALPHLQVLALGGEPLPAALAATWADANGGRVQLHNTYGVTECMGYQTMGRVRADGVDGGRPPRAGGPLPGAALALRRPSGGADSGVTRGAFEVLVGGAALCDGYWRDAAGTAASFVHVDDSELELLVIADADAEAPWRVVATHGDTTRRWFATGDLGVWEAGGLRLLGRCGDAQVKLRGMRLELGEVEAAATTCALVRTAAARVFDSGQMLALYVVPTVDRRAYDAGGETALRLHLARLLPAQLMPSRIVAIEALPLTAGGKLVRSELPPPPPRPRRAPSDGDDGDDARLLTPTEHAVAAAWEATLALDAPIRADDNWWELGGTSVRAVAMLRALSYERGTQVFATRLCGLHRRPTLRGFATWLDWTAREGPDDAPRGGEAPRGGAELPRGEEEASRGSASAAAVGGGEAIVAAADVALSSDAESARRLGRELAAASAVGSVTVVEALLHVDAPVSGGGRARHVDAAASPLHMAARGGHVDVLRALIGAGARVNVSDVQLRTAAHVAAGGGHVAALELLLRRGAATRARDAVGWTPLFNAAWAGSVECTQLLLRHAADADADGAAAAANATDRWGKGPLCWACATAGGDAQLSVVRLLLGARALADGGPRPAAARLERWGGWSTPLHVALREGGEKSVAIARLLIGARADVNRRDMEQRAPLQAAEEAGGSACALLIASGARAAAPASATCRVEVGAGGRPPSGDRQKPGAQMRPRAVGLTNPAAASTWRWPPGAKLIF